MTMQTEALLSAEECQVILKRMKKSVNRDAAIRQNGQTMAILKRGDVPIVPTPPDPPPEGPAVDPPLAPAAYTPPGGATTVTSSAQFKSTLALTPARDIVVADSVLLDDSTYFNNPVGHRIYAEHQNSVESRCGIEFGGNFAGDGGIVRGVKFNIDSFAKMPQNGTIISVWGSGNDLQVLDCNLDGNDLANWGIRTIGGNSPAGLILERNFLEHFKEDAIRVVGPSRKTYHDATVPIVTRIRDISIDYCYRGAGGPHNGTGESGIWLECPVANPVDRIKMRRTYWMGFNHLNNSWDTTFSNLDIAGGQTGFYPTACYLEHWNQNNTWLDFLFYQCGSGFYCEWNDPAWGGTAAVILPCSMSNGTIDGEAVPKPGGGAYGTGAVGLYADQGNDGPTLTNILFKNLNWAGIGHHNGGSTIVNGGGLVFVNVPVDYTTSHKNTSSPVDGVLPT